MKISTEAGRPEGTWCSWNEPVGTGDGATASFLLPIKPEETRGLLVMRDYMTVEPDGRFREFDADGKIIRDEPDGWSLSNIAEGFVQLTFQRPPRVGAHVSISAIGRKVGDAFKILAMDGLLSKKFDELTPKELKTRKRDELAKFPAVQEFFRAAFMELAKDWCGITDGSGAPLPFTDANKKLFLDRTEPITFGSFVYERSRTIQRERLAGFEASVQD